MTSCSCTKWTLLSPLIQGVYFTCIYPKCLHQCSAVPMHSNWSFRRMLNNFWLRLRSPRSHSVCLSVCLSVCPAQSCLEHSIFIFQPQILHEDFMKSSWRLQDVFRMSSWCLHDVFRMIWGWLQDESESIKQAFREHSEHAESTQRILKEHSERKRPIRLHHTVGA